MTSAAVKFEDLLFAFEFVSGGPPGENEAYLDRETGAIHWHSDFGDNDEPLPDDIDDDEKYLAIPHKNDLDLGKRLVMRFTDEFLPDDADEVDDIFRRKGAYGRFKDLLDRRGKLEQWYEYEQRHNEEALRAWCQENGIEVQD